MNEILNDQLLHKASALAFSGYLTRGKGCVVIRESNVEGDLLNYVSLGDKEFPKEAKDIVESYNPDTELVLVIIDKSNTVLAIQLTVHQTKIAPKEAYREWQRKNGMGKFIRGEVLCIDAITDDIPSGCYIFQKRNGIMMELCEMGIDEDKDEIVQGDKLFKCHIDFEDSFEPLMELMIGKFPK